MATTVIAPGAQKAAPFTICIIANPFLEAPWRSGVIAPDPIIGQPVIFTAATQYICDAIFGRQPRQAEFMLGNTAIAPQVRVLCLYEPNLPQILANALVGLDAMSTMVIARRQAIASFLGTREIVADVAYAVSANDSHTRASAWPADDDVGRGGVPFTVDGSNYLHAYYSTIPGTIAIHSSAMALTALHEMQHALGSYQNGQITDLYVDSSAAINCKSGRPIPLQFASYQGTHLSSDTVRDSLGYPAGWSSYHCVLHDPARPAIMDNYWQTQDPVTCQNDYITRSFVLDRINAKLSR